MICTMELFTCLQYTKFSHAFTSANQPIITTSAAFIDMRWHFSNCHYTHTQLKFHSLNLSTSTCSVCTCLVMGEPPTDSFAQRLSLLLHISQFQPSSSPLFLFFFNLFLMHRHAGNVIVMQSDSSRTVNIDNDGCCESTEEVWLSHTFFFLTENVSLFKSRTQPNHAKEEREL